MRILFLLFIIFSGILLSITSCDIINPEEPIPAFLFIPEFSLITDEITEGTNSQKITEVHIFVANEFLGIFTLPATIPVLEEGLNEVQIFPAIRANGLGDITDIYPFYIPYEAELEFIPAIIDTIFPVTEYQETAKFFFEAQESFEDGTLAFSEDLDGNPETTIEITNQVVFEGNGSGLIQLEQDDDQIELGSNFITEMPNIDAITTYLELDYMTEITFLVGVLGFDSQGRIISSAIDKGVNPIDDWNKIYFDFTDEMIQLIQLGNQLAGYRFVIIADLFNGDPEQANIYLDNIKLVQFR